MSKDDINIKININSKTAERNLKAVGKIGQTASKQITTGFQSSTSALKVMQGVLGANVIQAAFRGIANVATSAFSTMINEASKVQSLTTRFKTLTGSMEEATKIMKDLKTFAAKTPFRLKGIADAGAVLKSFGVTTEDLLPTLQKIGDVAAASGGDIKDLGLIFGQVRSAGKLTGERLLQLQERGIPILEQLARQYGSTEAEARQMVTDGKIGFKEFEQAFDSLSKKGGFAFQGMETASKDWSGVTSTLQDNISDLTGELGKELLPVLTKLVKNLTVVISKNKELIKTQIKERFIDPMIIAFTKLNDILKNVTSKEIKTFFDLIQTGINTIKWGIWIGGGIKALPLLTKAFKGLTRAVVLFTSRKALGGTKEVLANFSKFTTRAGTAAATATPFLTKYATAISQIGKFASRASIVLTAFWSEGLNKGEDKFIKDMMKRSMAVQKFKQSLKSTEASYNVSKALGLGYEAPMSKQVMSLAPINAPINASTGTKTVKGKTAAQIAAEQAHKQHLIDMQLLTVEADLIAKDYQADKDANAVERVENQYQFDQDILDRKTQQREDLLKAQLNAEVQSIKIAQKGQAQKDAIAKAEAKSLIAVNKNKNQRVLQQEKSFAELQRQQQQMNLSATGNYINAGLALAKNGSEGQKALMIAGSIVNTWSAASSALANPPGPPYTLPLMYSTIALGAANTAAIMGVKFAQGGIVGGNSFTGDKVNASVNSGEMILNRRQQRELFDQSNGRGSGSGNEAMMMAINNLANRPVILMADDQAIAKSVSRGVEDGIIIGGN